MPSAKAATENVVGEVRADSLYTLDEVRKRLNLGQAALRSARRAGLPVKKIGRCRFIRGADLLAFVERESANDESTLERTH